jgi:hypothetical protein
MASFKAFIFLCKNILTALITEFSINVKVILDNTDYRQGGMNMIRFKRCISLSHILLAILLTLSLLLALAPVAVADSGGPDSYGYSYKDSDEPDGPIFSWIDLTGTGSPGPVGDDSYIEVPIGFDFSFYGETYDEIVVSTNGYLTFPYAGFDGTDWSNNCIPDSQEPDFFVAPFWDDLNPNYGGTIYYKTMGTAPNRQFVVEWHDVHHCCASGHTGVTFEAILYEQSNDILFQYQEVIFGGDYASADNGASATAGLENQDGSDGLQYSCNTAVIVDGLAIFLTYHEFESEAEFSATPTMGFTPLEVQFTDETPGEFNAWSWDFGDGGTSDLQNPVHTYEVPGPFTVSLTANGPSGRAVATKVDYIHPYTQGVGGEAYPVNWTTILPSILLGMLGMTVIMLLLRHQKAEA